LPETVSQLPWKVDWHGNFINYGALLLRCTNAKHVCSESTRPRLLLRKDMGSWDSHQIHRNP